MTQRWGIIQGGGPPPGEVPDTSLDPDLLVLSHDAASAAGATAGCQRLQHGILTMASVVTISCRSGLHVS